MNLPEDELTLNERITNHVVKAIAWGVMTVIIWRGGVALWSVFCEANFKAILMP